MPPALQVSSRRLRSRDVLRQIRERGPTFRRCGASPTQEPARVRLAHQSQQLGTEPATSRKPGDIREQGGRYRRSESATDLPASVANAAVTITGATTERQSALVSSTLKNTTQSP